MTDKRCSKCRIVKPIEEFRFRKDTKKYRNECKECRSKYKKEHWAKNKEKYKKLGKIYYKENKQYINKVNRQYGIEHRGELKAYKKIYNATHKEEIKFYNEKYRAEHREQIKEYINKKYAINPILRLNRSMSTGIYYALKDNKAGRHWENLVDFKLTELIKNIEGKFTKGMTWKNYGEWHLDHIKPKISFNYTTPEDDEFKKCWSLNNLQPLWAKDNLEKSDKIAKKYNNV